MEKPGCQLLQAFNGQIVKNILIFKNWIILLKWLDSTNNWAKLSEILVIKKSTPKKIIGKTLKNRPILRLHFHDENFFFNFSML